MKCMLCGNEIVWCRTLSGNLYALNKSDDANGPFVLVDGICYHRFQTTFALMHAGPFYQHHFDAYPDCPGKPKTEEKHEQYHTR